ncbi:MAG TPA: VWA domain-containing protein [Anaeromyxobacter sp.]
MTAEPLSFSLLGYALRLAEPAALRLVLAALAVGLAGAVGVARRRRALARAAGALAVCVAPRSGTARPAARVALSTAGLALLALALARPQAGTRAEVTRRAGLDVAVVLDVSRSMRARDVRPDRLSRAKLELAELLDGLAGDRVALVVFAGEPFVACPLTGDTAAAKLFLRAVEPEGMPRQGTALAGALLAAKDVLDAGAAGPRTRVVLVVSDGEDHEGGAASAARKLADAGIRIWALAAGTAEGAPVLGPAPAGTDRPLRDARGEPVVSRLDETTLRLVADLGGGEVLDLASPAHGVAAFRAALDRLERTELEGRIETTWEERYGLVALPGFLLLLAALLLPEARRAARSSEEAA